MTNKIERKLKEELFQLTLLLWRITEHRLNDEKWNMYTVGGVEQNLDSGCFLSHFFVGGKTTNRATLNFKCLFVCVR